MAGSYQHMVNRNGRLLGNERFTGMIENLGDAYEAAEECYGMIWFLAEALAYRDMDPATRQAAGRASRADAQAYVELARQHYKAGLRFGGISGQR